MSGAYGAGEDGPPWRPVGARADEQPSWDDSGWPQNQPSAWSQAQGAQGDAGNGYPGQGRQGQPSEDQGYGRPGYHDQASEGQGYGTAGYPSQGYGGQDYGGQDYGGQDFDGAGYGSGAGPNGLGYGNGAGSGDRGYGQPGGQPATGPAPSFQPQAPANGARQGPSGYDPRGSAPRRMAGRYGDGLPAGDYPPAPDDSFVPGFGPRDGFGGGGDFGGRRDEEPGRRDGGDRHPGYAGYGTDPRGTDPRGTDPRWRDGADPAAFGDGRWLDDRGPDPRGLGDPRSDRGDWDSGHDRPRKKATRWAPRILLLVVFGGIVAGVLVGALYVYGKYEAKYHPADYAGGGTTPTVTVEVPSGDTASGLAPTLVQLGVVASARAFTNAAEASADPTGLEPGFFTLNHHMQASLAYAALLNPKNRVQLGVTIPEGKRVSQVLLILAKETKIPLKNFQQVIDHPAKLGLPSYAKGKVEGYLFPATYAIEPHQTALEILQTMVARFNVEAAQVDLQVAAAKVGLTPTQVIIEASMAQAEGGSVADYPKIARVITNRLKIDMHLQFDSALLYGLNAYAINVTYKQIATKGPYNDFEHAGLPPGPISNPGDAAIQGVLHPASGPWLYFLTNSGGKSTFSATPLSGQ